MIGGEKALTKNKPKVGSLSWYIKQVKATLMNDKTLAIKAYSNWSITELKTAIKLIKQNDFSARGNEQELKYLEEALVKKLSYKS